MSSKPSTLRTIFGCTLAIASNSLVVACSSGNNSLNEVHPDGSTQQEHADGGGGDGSPSNPNDPTANGTGSNGTGSNGGGHGGNTVITSPPDAGSRDSSSPGDAPKGDAGPKVTTISFSASNVATPDLTGTGDLELPARKCIANTEVGSIDCLSADQQRSVAYSQLTQLDGSKVGIFAVQSLRVPSSGELVFIGSMPAVVFAATTIDVQGTLGTAINGESSTVNNAGGFASGGPGLGTGSQSQQTGAGGGSYCGKGGSAGPNGGGKTYGTPEMVPLLGGSSGGHGAGGTELGGRGGGALQLVAGGSINVGIGGVVVASGSGGDSSAGGGSGGAILLESSVVSIYGAIAANGGAGGSTTGRGQPGRADGTAANGGGQMSGVGSADSVPNGGDGVPDPVFQFISGAGGGAGRIRLVTASGSAMIAAGATISPSFTSGCSTQAVLRP